MSCSCGVDSGGEVKGCNNNGSCSTGGCNKMNVFDWLSNMDMPTIDTFDVMEVRFKGGRKEFFRNKDGLELVTGDAVIVDVPSGHHLGYIAMQGELVRLQMQKKKVSNNEDIKKIYRKATLKDLEKYDSVRKRDMPSLFRARQIIQEQKLQMKLSDVEYQADNTKATFYYSADQRVDFRELIKVLASEFRVRIEMRQISLRQEAGRLGGIGSCGRELCCSTWLSEFKTVGTSAARYQNLSLNPGKLSGQCGRLKCCLNYELETYMDALKTIPSVSRLKIRAGEAKLMKTDIFRQIMWFGVEGDSVWHPLPATRVQEIVDLNEKGEVPDSLTTDTIEIKALTSSLNSDLERMDKKFQKKSRNKNKPTNRNRGGRDKQPQNKQGKPQQQRQKKNKPKGEGGQGQKPRSQNPQRQNKPQGENKGQGPNAQKSKDQGGNKRRNNRNKPKPNSEQ